MAPLFIDDERIEHRLPNGLTECIAWNEIEKVVIMTTDAGPWADDVFYLVSGADKICMVPSETEGVDELIERLQRLDGFNNEMVITAMACTENREFICWEKGRNSV